MSRNLKLDDWNIVADEEEDLSMVLEQLESETEVMPRVIAKEVRLKPCPKPVDVGWEPDEVHEDTLRNSNLSATYGSSEFYLRDCAIETVESVAAKLNGSGLRLTREKDVSEYTNGINYFIRNTKGGERAMFIIRGGKLTAMHGKNYAYLPQKELYELVRDALKTSRYGGANFITGSVNHRITRVLWSLNRREITDGYRKIREEINAEYSGDFVCGVEFETSDVSTSCVDVKPVFIDTRTRMITSFCEGIKIAHENRRGSKTPMEVLRDKLDSDELITMFEESLEKIKALTKVVIEHPENCVVSLCNKYGIARKYGEIARAKVEIYPSLTAYDIYCFVSTIIPEAKVMKATESTLIALESSIFKIVSADWSEHDHGGVVPWKK